VVGLTFIVRQRERRIFEKLDVTVEQAGLATSALTFLATVHQRNSLTERRIEHGFALFNFHFDAERLETDGMNCWCRHGVSLGLCPKCLMFLVRIDDARLG
jgi:hypothetical protein